jgi:hypothetical protein
MEPTTSFFQANWVVLVRLTGGIHTSGMGRLGCFLALDARLLLTELVDWLLVAAITVLFTPFTLPVIIANRFVYLHATVV